MFAVLEETRLAFSVERQMSEKKVMREYWGVGTLLGTFCLKPIKVWNISLLKGYPFLNWLQESQTILKQIRMRSCAVIEKRRIVKPGPWFHFLPLKRWGTDLTMLLRH
ncbi:MAG: hypothetical protein U5R49_06970 [Deltaproteobacteria bacterium]|nr:hypothetical protein [Deltaproteobacteria bacterium]